MWAPLLSYIIFITLMGLVALIGLICHSAMVHAVLIEVIRDASDASHSHNAFATSILGALGAIIWVRLILLVIRVSHT